ncbi:hypothetical protein M9H77_35558 [Catharanthus roseus]|uniref:Uncharacterized protein n=1 Tax=Catharanthus roseus TaxID=4058 RepID=A0ACB9ZR89_CATRO|nr:hypothetical protein M9H77_35558 [Catharanthus roseus]
MATSENWQLFIHDGRHNHAIAEQTEQFRKSNVPPLLRFFREQNVGCAVRAQKIYNVVVKIKKNRMQGQNTAEVVLCLSAQRGGNVLSDIVVAHPTSIEMMRMWLYIKHLYFSNAMSTKNQQHVNDHELKVIITNRESGLMPVIDDVFSTAYHMLCRRHIGQNVLAKLTELTKDEEIASRFINRTWKKLLNEIDEQEYLRNWMF